MMYRGYIIAQYKNMFDIADIYGDRKWSELFGDPVSPSG
jgi:predicted oxidoreductase